MTKKFLFTALAGVLAVSACSRSYDRPEDKDILTLDEISAFESERAAAKPQQIKGDGIGLWDRYKNGFEHRILFGLGDHTLTHDDKEALDQLIARSEEFNTFEFIVFGHTDEIGSEEANDELSHKRTLAVIDYLTSQSIDPAKIVSKSFSERKLAVEGNSDWRHHKNRRVEIILHDPARF